MRDCGARCRSVQSGTVGITVHIRTAVPRFRFAGSHGQHGLSGSAWVDSIDRNPLRLLQSILHLDSRQSFQTVSPIRAVNIAQP